MRKLYSKDQFGFLRCRDCGVEFTAWNRMDLGNTMAPMSQAMAVSEH